MSAAVVPAGLVTNWIGEDELLPGDVYNMAARIREYDPRLRIGVNALTGKYEVFYVSLRLGDRPQLIHVVEDPVTKAWRPLDQRVITWLHESDTRRADRSWRAWVRRQEALKANRESYMRDLYANLREDVETAAQVSGTHRTRFYMYRPKTRARHKQSLEVVRSIPRMEDVLRDKA